MKLADIRQRLAYDPDALPTQKAATRTWLSSLASNYPIALTLTLKQSVKIQSDRGCYSRVLSRDDCENAAKRFTQKLNRAVYGTRAAEKYGKRLKYIAVIEGVNNTKNLHLHLAIGGLPKHVRFNQVGSLVRTAKTFVDLLDVQHTLDIADSGWLEYICKELPKSSTDNVLWTLS